MAEENKGFENETETPTGAEKALKEENKPSEKEEEPEVRIPETEKERNAFAYKLRKENAQLKKELAAAKEGTFDFENENKPEEKDYVTHEEFEKELQSWREQQTSEELLHQFLDKYPSYKKYEPKIRKYMNHSAYKNVPIGFIADGIAGKDLKAEGAEAEKKAELEAQKSETGGSTHRKTSLGKLPKIWDMSKEDFEKLQTEVRRKSRD